MVIKRSSAREIGLLLDALEHGDGVARDAAVARLAVIGTRAVEGLVRVAVSGGTPAARTGALTALEGLDDPRVVDAAFIALGDGNPEVRAGAVSVVRGLLDTARDREVLDRLVPLALDRAQTETLRLAALDALGGLPATVTRPLLEKLAADPSAAVRARVTDSAVASPPDPLAIVEAAALGTLPSDADALRKAVTQAAPAAPLPTLHRLIEAIHARESSLTDAQERLAWTTARASVHRALADRDSRVALYDLRDTIAAADTSVPVEMLAALEAIGDKTCLEPIASAYARLSMRDGSGSNDEGVGDAAWWRTQLVSAFRAIAAREGLTERNPLTKRLRSRWPDAAKELLGR